MHTYKRHIGDYHKKAGRLSILQHGIYTLLLDACYDREQFPTKAEALEWTWASTSEELAALDLVLSRFFVQDNNGRFVQKRVADELEQYREFCEQQAARGKAGGRPKKNPAESIREPIGKHSGFENNPAGFGNNPPAAGGKPIPITDSLLPIADNQESADKSAGRGKPLRTLAGYVEDRKTHGQKVIPDDHAVFAYATNAGIPHEFLQLAWLEFKARYTTSPDDQKKYRDWPAVFLKAVKGNWLKVWFIDAGQYKLTTIGQQADMARRANVH